MSQTSEITHETPVWLDEMLWGLDIATGAITIFNVLFLRYRVPYVNQRAWDRRSRISISTRISDEVDPLLQQKQNQRNRKAIQKYFYLIAVIPLFVCICSHCGARFPHQSIWIFPGMSIVIAIAYLLFIKMMIISCDGWSKIKSILVKEPDECRAWLPLYQCCIKRVFCSCFLRENAYLGLKQRITLCLLIMLKPILNYCTAYWQFDDSSATKTQIISYLFRVLLIITTVIPLKTMESFHGALLPYTRMRRSTIKRVFVSFLGPICQVQEVVIGTAFKLWNFDMKGVDEEYEWVEWYGLLLCFEMLLFSMLTVYAFNPRDLRLWEYAESLISVDDGYELSDMSEVSKDNEQPAGIVMPYEYKSGTETSVSS